jgi:hypothetical protein
MEAHCEGGQSLPLVVTLRKKKAYDNNLHGI